MRRIHPNHVDPEGRVLWLAFRGAQLSVDREGMRSPSLVRAAFPSYTVARLVAGDCRAAGFAVLADPLPDNPAHALVTSTPATRGDERRLALILRGLAEWPAR